MSKRRYRVVVTDLPPEDERRELLELVLAAASLDLPLEVLLIGSAGSLLSGADAAGWLQLLEHDLAEIRVAAGVSGAAEPALKDDLPSGVEWLGPEDLSRLPAADVIIHA